MKKLVYLLFIVSIILPVCALAVSQTDYPASVVVGQDVFGYVPGVANGGLANGGDMAHGLYNPSSVSSNGTKLAVADYSNNRILIYNTIPTTSNPKPDVIVGLPDLYLGFSENGQYADTSINTLKEPAGVFLSNTKLFISDYSNNRVLIYNSIPMIDGVSPDVVVGQMDFNSSDANQGGSVADNTLHHPRGLYSDDTKLIISDHSNNRVLIYNTIPVTNGASADVVIGQAIFTTSGSNQGGIGANTLYTPSGLYSDGTKLIISDYANHRVLVFDAIPVANDVSADVVIGQAVFTSRTVNQAGIGANTLYQPQGVYSDGTKLFIADSFNHRVLVFNAIPVTDDASADTVIGQPDFISNVSNQGGDVGTNTLYQPQGVYSDGTKLFIADSFNHRVLVFNAIPVTDDASADTVIGQPSMTVNNLVQSNNISASSTNEPLHSIVVDSKLIVAECSNSRILIYNTVPTTNGASADVVIGQSDFISGERNRGSSIGDDTLSCPYHLFVSGEKLFVADNGNNRVLIYNTIPTTNGASADVVIGQPDMTTGTGNINGISAATIKNPVSVYSDGTKLFIADRQNNRVLIYNAIPTTNGSSADVVVGQPDFISGDANQGGSVGANTFYLTNDVDVADGRLIVADLINYRVLIFNTVPTANNASADVVIGQVDMLSRDNCVARNGDTVNASCFSAPLGAYSDDTRLYVSDFYNHRILIFNTVPTANNASADAVIGQADFSMGISNQGGYPAANTLQSPVHLFVSDDKLFVPQDGVYLEAFGGRVLVYSLGPQNASVNIPSTSTELEISLTLEADDAKEYIVSENSDFSGSSWQAYVSSPSFTLSEGKGQKNVYIKMRDYINYESSVFTSSLSFQPPGGGMLPQAYLPPARGKTGQLTVSINQGQQTTDVSLVTLNLQASSDVNRVAISNSTDFSNTSLLAYTKNLDWDICNGIDNCANGDKMVYVKFYTQYGVASSPVSASINFQAQEQEQVMSEVVLNTYVNKLVKYSNSPKIYYINSDNIKQWIPSEDTFIQKGYLWSDIININSSQAFESGQNVSLDEKDAQPLNAWTPPDGYIYINSSSSLPLYKDIINQPGTLKKFGLVLGISNIPTNNSFVFTESMRLGSRSDQVKKLQTILINMGIFNYPEATGYFGAITKEAVKKFQQNNGLVQAGIVGPMTRAILNDI